VGRPAVDREQLVTNATEPDHGKDPIRLTWRRLADVVEIEVAGRGKGSVHPQQRLGPAKATQTARVSCQPSLDRLGTPGGGEFAVWAKDSRMRSAALSPLGALSLMLWCE
jgi:hypothetical protein